MAVCIAVAPADELVVRPEAAPGPLDNPFNGWCPYAGAGTIHQPYSVVFLVEGRLEANAAPGHYKFALAVIDPWTGRPAIRFANRMPTHQGSIELSTVTVGEGR